VGAASAAALHHSSSGRPSGRRVRSALTAAVTPGDTLAMSNVPARSLPGVFLLLTVA
jgi:hypothetical protein